MTRRYVQLDVFATRPGAGNPLAVVLDAQGLDDAAMQAIARWTRLPETTFVFPSESDDASYRIRMFSPRREVPFAGHPSVGTAYALLEAGAVTAMGGALVQECEAGLLPVRVSGEGRQRKVAVRSPDALPLAVDDQGTLSAALSGLPLGKLAPVLYHNGPRWWLVELQDEVSVRSHQPDLARIADLCRATAAVGLAVFAAADDGQDHQWVVRAYCPADGIPEDPVTGSVNASIGAYLRDAGRLAVGDHYLASQGRELDRDGHVEVRIADDGVWIGGQSVTVVDGSITLG
ncbi:MAG: PhzF family phenazine biosynthesis protein [Xanthomonadales bacterium]|nr:PhzF family phenazine biosynthesis protein [Xanthomonadales bacterium]